MTAPHASRRGLIPRQLLDAGWGPAWVPRAVIFTVPFVTAIGALMQRQGHTALPPASGWALLAIAPLALGAFDVEVPWAPAMLAADVGTFMLLRHAQQFDLAPFILVATVAAAGMARPAFS